VRTEVEGTPLIERISEQTYAAALADAQHVLAPFATASGRVDIPLEGHIVTGRKR
jgi:hypothetical protein